MSLKPRCKYASKGERDLSGMIPDEGSMSGHASVVSRMGLREPNHNGGASGVPIAWKRPPHWARGIRVYLDERSRDASDESSLV